MGIKRVDKIRLDEMRVEVGGKKSFEKKWGLTKTGDAIKCPGIGGKREARKAENGMGDLD